MDYSIGPRNLFRWFGRLPFSISRSSAFEVKVQKEREEKGARVCQVLCQVQRKTRGIGVQPLWGRKVTLDSINIERRTRIQTFSRRRLRSAAGARASKEVIRVALKGHAVSRTIREKNITAGKNAVNEYHRTKNSGKQSGTVFKAKRKIAFSNSAPLFLYF